MLRTLVSAFDLVRTSGVTATDFCLVLAALLILVLLVSFFRNRSAVNQKKVSSVTSTQAFSDCDEIDGELLAVISAAVYDYLGDNSRDSYRIVSVSPQRAVRSAWAQAGINRNTSRF